MEAPPKAVFSTNEARAYVGGKLFFDQLLAAYPKILTPVAVCKPTRPNARGKTKYLRASIDTALKAAQMSQQFVTK